MRITLFSLYGNDLHANPKTLVRYKLTSSRGKHGPQSVDNSRQSSSCVSANLKLVHRQCNIRM